MAKLSEMQIAAIEYLALPKRGGLTYAEIAKEVGVNERTLLRWRDDDTFHAALNRRIVRSLSDRLPEVMASIPDHIINDGNAALYRTTLQALGLLTEKVEVNTKDSGTDMDAMKAQIERFRSGNGEATSDSGE